MTTLPIARFAPVALPDLLAEAELLTRFDRKYLLDRQQAESLLSEFDPGTRVLAIDGRRCFSYESVYFDTPELLSYRQAAHARRRRFKVRTRSYLDSGLAYLEVKVRGDRQVPVKPRIDYDLGTRDQLTALGRDYTADILDRWGMDGSVVGRLFPTLATRYTRITLLPEPGVRVTVDTDLTWTAIHARGGVQLPPQRGSGRHIWQPVRPCDETCTTSLALPDLVIVETKAGARPAGIDRLLGRHGHRPLAISKYATGLAALRGGLPANRWARILRHHFPEELPCAA